VIDLHSHILPGIDDGPETLEGSLELARAALADGIETIAATPHVRDDYPTTPEVMERAVAGLRVALTHAGLPLDVRTGGEIAIERIDGMSHEDLRRFGLGGNPRYLLLEFPYGGWPLVLADIVFSLRVTGITPVIGHPERNAEVQADPDRLGPLVDQGALVQLTAASLVGRVGRGAQRAAVGLLDRELVHLLASDAHAPGVRKVGLSDAREAVGEPQLARWLVDEVPRAIVEDTRLPTRPARAKRRWFDRSRR
jgi:protein-tyrosine phosphatase